MKVTRTFVASLLGGLLLVGSQAFAQTSTWKIDPNHSEAGFQVKHLSVSNVRGSLGAVNGTVNWDEKDPTKSTVAAVVETKGLDTRVQKRNDHLKSADFFDVEKYPTLTFKSTEVKRSGDSYLVTGDLTLNGVTKPVTLTVDGPTPPQKNQQGKLVTGFSATGSIKRSDFNFGGKFPDAVVSDLVKITIDVEADKE
ncbi:YceI family protein [Terriglobus albidus]|uniref:YceI family protein n=1 Tax=Terriglobus albidus TaxID=1592106 RepID=A0A5B9E3K8_9BACT|nr:YceI family protein [Terriglobus albidus]QEE26842.1 YceI family protein [Terriglobus albidus]